MRPLELSIPILLTVYLLWTHPRPLLVRLAPAVALVITLIHFATEGYRWQMIPLYVLTPFLAITSLVKIFTSADWAAFASYLTIILLALCTALPILLPGPSIQTASGESRVGTTTFYLTDLERKELYSGRDEPRRIVVQMWYPARQDAGEKRAPWMSDAGVYTPAISDFLNLPPFFLDHLSLVKTPAFQDAGIEKSNKGYPVILFSHGWNGFHAQNSGQAIELASHGFVVVAVNHTYGAIATVFEDGTIVYNNPNALPEDAPNQEYELAAQRLADQWAGDIAFTIETLGLRNSDIRGSYYSAFDLEHIGVYGHSTGGGAAIQFCGQDPRCDAVLGMDPFMRPVSTRVIDGGLSQPSLFMFSEGWADDLDSRNNQLFDRFSPHLANDLGVFVIRGTRHYDFSDLPLLSPIAPQLGLKGPLDGSRVTQIVNSYLVAFFELTLKGIPSTLMDGIFNEYPANIELKADDQ